MDRYTTKYDNIDVDRIVASRRLLQNYVKCLLDQGPCTAEGKELKSKWWGGGVVGVREESIGFSKFFQICYFVGKVEVVY